MKILNIFPLLTVLILLIITEHAQSCTSILCTKGASRDGSVMITYTADSHTLYGELDFLPASHYRKGEMLQVVDSETGKVLGEIPQASSTYNVTGYMNEHQVVMSETTFTGRKELRDPKGLMDYDSLITIALQRAKTAREAIGVMTDLAEKYGYCSVGESFSIGDKNEAWIMEMIGKGAKEKGAVWVARKIPEGYICAHANQARIRQFPLNDKENCIFAKDVISFAKKHDYFKGNDSEFSFADAYAPLTFSALRACEARVWQIFRRAAPTMDLPIDLVKGTGKKRPAPMPLWIIPENKLSVQDVMELMRDHFEGTEFDLSKGVGAGSHHLPYRWRPLTWKIDDIEYFNERSTSTQQTAYSFVSQSRSSLPDEIGGLLWFGVDDTYSTVYVPIYAAINEVPKAFASGMSSLYEFNWDSAFWVFNFVANFSYSRYCDMIKDIRREQGNIEGRFFANQPRIENTAMTLYRQSPELSRDYLTEYSARQTELVMSRWKKLLTDLLVKYMDGNVKEGDRKVTHPEYPEDWYRRIIKENGDFLKVRRIEGEPLPEKPKRHR